MILALKGHSCSTKSLIARQLADFLKYPLIDEDDVLAIQNSLPTASEKAIVSTKHLNNLSFELVCQITSTQLHCKIGVIVNTPLFNQSNLGRLVQLSRSTGASLIIIECKTEEDGENDDDYNIGYVPKHVIDTSRPFVVEDFVSKIPQLSEFHPKVDQITRDNPSTNLSTKTWGEKFYRHLHALTLTDQPRKGDELKCKSCLKSVSGPTYQCVVCDEYIFHKSCAESPGKGWRNWLQCPAYLKEFAPAEYHFPETQTSRCKYCEVFSYDCHDCLLETNLKCRFLPTIINHEGHQHRLNLVIMPTTYDYEYECSDCLESGRSISYKCYDCNFNIHTNCAVRPKVGKRRLDDFEEDFLKPDRKPVRHVHIPKSLRDRDFM